MNAVSSYSGPLAGLVGARPTSGFWCILG